MSVKSGLAAPLGTWGSVSVTPALLRSCLGSNGARSSGRAQTLLQAQPPLHPTHLWGLLCTGTEPRERPQAPPRTSADFQQRKPLPKPIFQTFFPVWELHFHTGTLTRIFMQLGMSEAATDK